MRVQRFTDIEEFWTAVGPLLLADPVRHTVALTVLRRARVAPDTDWAADGLLLAVRGDDNRVLGAAFRTPPWPTGISGLTPELVPVIVDFLLDGGLAPGGATGPRDVVDRFADLWHDRTGDDVTLLMDQRLYRLGTLEPPAVPGSVRVITKADLAGGPPDEVTARLHLLARWRADFLAEAVSHVDEPDQAAIINRAIVSGSGYAIWTDDGIPRAMSAASAPLGGMSRIGPVYTPPEHRRRGYGAAVTAGVARWAMEQEAENVLLFTDLTNPTSNSIYQSIGFRPLLDAAEYRFDTAHD